MIMMFSALGVDLLPASGAVAVKIWCVITTIQLLYVCLTGRNIRQSQKKEVVFVKFFFRPTVLTKLFDDFHFHNLKPSCRVLHCHVASFEEFEECALLRHMHLNYTNTVVAASSFCYFRQCKMPVNLHWVEKRQVGWSAMEGKEAGGWMKRVAGELCVCVCMCVSGALFTLHLLSPCVVQLWVLHKEWWKVGLWPAEWHPCLGFHKPTTTTFSLPIHLQGLQLKDIVCLVCISRNTIFDLVTSLSNVSFW